MSRASSKAELALSALNRFLTLPGEKLRVTLPSFCREGQAWTLETRSFRGARKAQMGKTKPQECFATVSFSIQTTVLETIHLVPVLATVCTCSFSRISVPTS